MVRDGKKKSTLKFGFDPKKFPKAYHRVVLQLRSRRTPASPWVDVRAEPNFDTPKKEVQFNFLDARKRDAAKELLEVPDVISARVVVYPTKTGRAQDVMVSDSASGFVYFPDTASEAVYTEGSIAVQVSAKKQGTIVNITKAFELKFKPSIDRFNEVYGETVADIVNEGEKTYLRVDQKSDYQLKVKRGNGTKAQSIFIVDQTAGGSLGKWLEKVYNDANKSSGLQWNGNSASIEVTKSAFPVGDWRFLADKTEFKVTGTVKITFTAPK